MNIGEVESSMNALNKLVGFIVNPLSVGMLLIVVSFILVYLRRRKCAVATLAFSFLWFYFWSAPIVGAWMALHLERDYPVQLAEDMPEADAIILLGGGVRGVTNYPYAMLRDGSDRAWHSARLWKAGKAPIIIPSNIGAEFADVRLLVDLGVPREAIILENKAVNTEQNAKLVREVLLGCAEHDDCESRPKVLIVTSACHMRRSMYMFEKYAPDIECIPAATDYQELPFVGNPFDWRNLLPSIAAFARSNSYVHEYIGYWGYRFFR